MSRSVLITGAGGFVGRHLIQYALNRDADVVGLRKPGKSRIAPGQVDWYSVDVTNQSRITQVISRLDPDWVFHLAGVSHVPRSIKHPRKTYQVNFKGTLNLLESLSSHNGQTSVLLAGTASEYGETARDYIPLSESDPLAPNTPYGVSKASMDLLGGQWGHSSQLDVIRVRASPHTGPGQRDRFVCSNFARQVSAIERGSKPVLNVGNVGVVRDILDVRDVVDAYWKLMNSDVTTGVFNVCRGEGHALEQVIEILRNLTDGSFEVEPEPERKRSDEIFKIVGDPSLLKTQVDWTPNYELRRTIEDLLSYWREQERD